MSAPKTSETSESGAKQASVQHPSPVSAESIENQPAQHSSIAVPTHKFPPRILNAGFVFALILAAFCLIASTVYLYTFLSVTTHKIDGLLSRAGTPGVSDILIQLGINAALVSARLALLSCGVFVAMAFGFLGFGLFLMGVRGEIEASGTTESFGFKVARMSPGVFVMSGTLVLIGVCVTHRTPFDYRMEQNPHSPVVGEKTAASILRKYSAEQVGGPPLVSTSVSGSAGVPTDPLQPQIPSAVPSAIPSLPANGPVGVIAHVVSKAVPPTVITTPKTAVGAGTPPNPAPSLAPVDPPSQGRVSR